MDDYALLGLGEATSLIDDVELDEEKKIIVISCIYSPLATKIKYRLLFQGCREISWDRFPGSREPIFPADLLGISLRDDKQRQFAVLSTDSFELSFLYDGFTRERASG